MQHYFVTPITYFLQEGRENLGECLKIALRAAKQHNIQKIVMFTAKGDGVRLFFDNYVSAEEYRGVHLVAVTFPKGKQFSRDGVAVEVDIPAELEKECHQRAVPVIRGHLPFDPIEPPFAYLGNLGQDLSLIGSALNVFGGSMSLCVQAILLACDSGAVALGEHVIAMTSDTAILVQATNTRRMLKELVIREVLCKPAILSIGRNERQIEAAEPQTLQAPKAEHKKLP